MNGGSGERRLKNSVAEKSRVNGASNGSDHQIGMVCKGDDVKIDGAASSIDTSTPMVFVNPYLFSLKKLKWFTKFVYRNCAPISIL